MKRLGRLLYIKAYNAKPEGTTIDELFMEVHTDLNSCCRPPHDRGRHRADALRLIQELRRAGVYAHEWI